MRNILAASKVFVKPLKGLPTALLTLGDHIRKLRIERNLLQRDVAIQLHVSEPSVTNWENNNTQPQLKYYPAIIAFLGYDPFALQGLTFAELLRQYRRTHGLSIKRMGALVGVNGSTILSWEKDECMPSPHLHEKVLLLLHSTPLTE